MKKIEYYFYVLLLVLSILPTRLKADIAVNSPDQGAIFKPGDIIHISWDYKCPNNYSVVIKYTAYESGIPVAKTHQIFQKEEAYDWQVPCNIVLSPAPNIPNIEIKVRNHERNANVCYYHDKYVNVTAYSDEVSLPPVPKQVPYVRCAGGQQSVCIQDTIRTIKKFGGLGIKYIREDRLIRWYGASAQQLLTTTPAQIIERIAEGSFGVPIAFGIGKTCLTYAEQKGFATFFVTGTITYGGCGEEYGLTSIAGQVIVVEVPDLTGSVDFPRQPVPLKNDNKIPCPDEFDCFLPGTYYNLPAADINTSFLPLGYNIANSAKVVWKDQNGSMVRYTKDGSSQRVCHDDLNKYPDKIGKYTAYITFTGDYAGQSFKCDQQKGEVSIIQSGTVDPFTVLIIGLVYDAAEVLSNELLTLLGIGGEEVDPCIIARILFEQGLFPDLLFPMISTDEPPIANSIQKIMNTKWKITPQKLKVNNSKNRKIREEMTKLVEYQWRYDATKFTVKEQKQAGKPYIIKAKKGIVLQPNDSVSLYVRLKSKPNSAYVLAKSWKLN